MSQRTRTTHHPSCPIRHFEISRLLSDECDEAGIHHGQARFQINGKALTKG
jgi:hypothetical protein